MLAYVISALSNWLYTYILVALLLAAGLYFTLRTRFVQLRMFGESFRSCGRKSMRKAACLRSRR